MQELGLPHDPHLVLKTAGFDPIFAEQSVREFLASGRRCTAIVAADDDHASGLMRGLRNFGLRIPEDVAVVGFDDVAEAQYAEPPLTTVRQRFDELGRIAVRALHEHIRDRGMPARTIMVPTAPIIRVSCGCSSRTDDFQIAPEQYIGDDWQTRLTADLVQHLMSPQQPDPNLRPEQIWPGVATLVSGMVAALEGRTTPDVAAYERAWRQAVALSHGLLALHDLVNILREAAIQRSVGHLDVVIRVRSYIDSITRILLLVYQERVLTQSAYQAELPQINQQITMNLLNRQTGEGWNLDWMQAAAIQWGCLALREGEQLVVVGAYSASKTAPLPHQHDPFAAFPPDAALTLSLSHGEPIGTKLLPLRYGGHERGILAIVGPFTYSAHDSATMWSALLAAALERESIMTALAAERTQVQASYERERILAATVRDLGCPMLPLRDGLLLVPLLGAIDSRRAQQIAETVLAEVSRQQATAAIFDISGVPIVDTQVAAALLQTAAAVRLLGARTALVGVRPEIAQSIIGMGVDLSSVTPYPSLAAALRGIVARGERRPLRIARTSANPARTPPGSRLAIRQPGADEDQV